MNACFVGIDTSNYTTSCAVCDGDGNVLANVRLPLPVREGERGLRQSDAVFAHVRNLPEALREIRAVLRERTPLAVGVSDRPRRAEGSYMPCFLAGVAAAEAFAAPLTIPVYRFAHQEGHVMAAVASAGAGRLLGSPFVAFHVSGGTTEVLRVSPRGVGFNARVIGGTADLHAGQAIDRVGVLMGLRFPCGKEMETLAAQNREKVPAPRVSVSGTECHFSGLENLAAKLWNETKDPALVSAYVMDFTAETLARLTAGVDEQTPGVPIVYAGGVMSNRRIRERLAARENTFFAEPAFSADNAAGVALLCKRAHEAGEKGEQP